LLLDWFESEIAALDEGAFGFNDGAFYDGFFYGNGCDFDDGAVNGCTYSFTLALPLFEFLELAPSLPTVKAAAGVIP
jgi:hypothetical protein